MIKTMIILFTNRLLSSISFFYILLLCSSHVFCCAKDILNHGEWMSDNGSTLVSPGGMFELGFFTPMETSSSERFVGIWYHGWGQQKVVWVANRNEPIPDGSTGVFGIADDGNLKVLDNSSKEYWSTTVKKSLSANRTVKLMDSGNLVLSGDNDQLATSLWESFKNPTDTFILGMKMDGNIKLVSWTNSGDPRSGNFTFSQDELQGEDSYAITKIPDGHWQSRLNADEMPSEVACLLSSNFSTISCSSYLLNLSRLVMSYSGQLNHLTWDVEKKYWALKWWEPKDKCKIYNVCGKFGSCNINNKKLCKCLPGFMPSNLEKWNSEDFFDGCTRNQTCDKSDTFLSLKMMKASNTNAQFGVKNEAECKSLCLGDCRCQAYSYEAANSSKRSGDTTTSTDLCLTWSDDLINLQEEYENGRNLSVRVAKSDIGTVLHINIGIYKFIWKI